MSIDVIFTSLVMQLMRRWRRHQNHMVFSFSYIMIYMYQSCCITGLKFSFSGKLHDHEIINAIIGGGGESGVAISQIPDLLGLYSLIPEFLGLYSLIPDVWGLYSLIPDFRPLRPVPTFSRPIIMFYIFHMIEKIYINAYPPPLPY